MEKPVVVVHMINRKAVTIIARYSTTAVVKYVKTGITQSVGLAAIRTYYPKEKPQKQVPKPKENNQDNDQLKLDL